MRSSRLLAYALPGVALAIGCSSGSSGGGTFTGDDGGSSSSGSSGGSSGSSGGGSSGGSSGGGMLRIQPTSVTLAAVVTGGSSQQSIMVLEHNPMVSFDSNVTPMATITLGDPMIATVTNPMMATSMSANISGGKYGGNTTITATLAGDTSGTAMLKVQLTGDIAGGVGGKDQGNFASAPVNASAKPTVMSPTSGSTLTSASPPLQVSWATCPGCVEYRVHIQSTDLLDVFQYTTGATNLTFDATAWPNILKSMVGATATVTAEGWDHGVPGNRYVSDPVMITVSQ